MPDAQGKYMTKRRDDRPGNPPIFVLALCGFPKQGHSKGKLPTWTEFYKWLDAGKPDATWKDSSLKYVDDGTDVGRVV